MVKIVQKFFTMEFDDFNPNARFTYEFSEESINFLDIKASNGKPHNSSYLNSTDCHQYLRFQSSLPNILKNT